ncbi:MAG: aminotransferase class I/II-fold pyridoxal phosphate-dependent enzyme [Xenococcaceae cyanobacterium MO_167.B52]|nr:aminotransferase class I/II-fold pyridoxal phosphate-dependent enzyme [Xenococcaceae cyanobacterium MO_167.B52]
MMEFTKDFKIPDPVPQEGIEQAIKLMKTGRMYRYNFHAEFEEPIDPSQIDDELATEVAKLEYEFSRYVEHKYAIAVNSCGSALFMSLKAAGLQYQDKVFTNGFTFTAVPSSIVHAGGIPIYLECNSQYLIDLEDFKRKIQEHPDAKYFIVSHMRGHVSDMEAIKQICDEEGIYLIEDCAHSLGAKWKNGKHVGHTAKIACFSSQSYKMLNSGEGGFIATSDDRVAAYCILAAGCYEKLYKKHLSRPFNDDVFEKLKPHVPNFSLRMNNLTAAVIRPQIGILEEKIQRYKLLYNQLKDILNTVEGIHIPPSLDQVDRAPDSMQFNLLNFTKSQVDQFVKDTAVKGLKIQIFGRLDNARYFKNWQYSFTEMPELKQTEEIISCACDLRLSPAFTTGDIDTIGRIIKSVINDIVSEANKTLSSV